MNVQLHQKNAFFSNHSSSKFSLSDFFMLSGTFIPSSPFTQPNFFTPNRTKVPDPQNIFYKNAQVGCSNKNVSIFTKDEVKKAAVPLNFFIVLTPTSIVMFVFYFIKNSKYIPIFDSSFIIIIALA